VNAIDRQTDGRTDPYFNSISKSRYNMQRVFKKSEFTLIIIVQVTGEQFLKYVKKWAEKFEDTELPEVKNIFSSTKEIHFNIVESLAINLYKEIMAPVNIDFENPGLCPTEFEMLHQNALAAAVALFKKRQTLNQLDDQDLDTIRNKILAMMVQYKALNAANVRAYEAQKFRIYLIAQMKAQSADILELKKKLEEAEEKQRQAVQNAREHSIRLKKISRPSWLDRALKIIPPLASFEE